MKSVQLQSSPLKTKKYRITWFDENKNKIKHADFGAKGMSDFTIHKDQERKQRFLNRFHKLIQKYKNDPYSPMTLSTMILWNKPTLKASLTDYKKRFNFS